MQDNAEQTKKISSDNSSKNSKDTKNSREGFFSQCKAEFKKITWPTRKVLVKHTTTVVLFSLVVGAIIFVYDLGIDFLLRSLVNLTI